MNERELLEEWRKTFPQKKANPQDYTQSDKEADWWINKMKESTTLLKERMTRLKKNPLKEDNGFSMETYNYHYNQALKDCLSLLEE